MIKIFCTDYLYNKFHSNSISMKIIFKVINYVIYM